MIYSSTSSSLQVKTWSVDIDFLHFSFKRDNVLTLLELTDGDLCSKDKKQMYYIDAQNDRRREPASKHQ